MFLIKITVSNSIIIVLDILVAVIFESLKVECERVDVAALGFFALIDNYYVKITSGVKCSVKTPILVFYLIYLTIHTYLYKYVYVLSPLICS